MKVDMLTNRGIQKPLIDIWKKAGISTLTDCQEKVLSHQPLWDRKNILVVAPTSSGKTFVGEVLAADSALSMKRAIVLVPFKVIAEEKYAEFKDRYGPLGISVVISDGDHTLFDNEIRRGDFGIAVIVYEKMAQLLVQSPGILVNCSLMMIDEIQMIADPARGPRLEVLLTHVRKLSEQPQIIGLSATMSDLGGLDSWLGADVIESYKRPVPLWEGIAFPIGSTELINVETEERKVGPDLASVAVPQSTSFSSSKLDVAYRVLLAEGPSKQTLIFRTRVDDTVSTAQELAYFLPTSSVEPVVRDRIAGLEETPVRDFLSQWIDKRVAYHNAGMSIEERRTIERFFREGIIRVLVTTSTLAAGVNTPADTSIVLDYKRFVYAQMTSLPIPVEEYRNSVGRAGRFGLTSEGHSYLIVDGTNELKLVENNYLSGNPRQLRSALPVATDVGVLALGLLSLGQIVDESDLRDTIRYSFAFNHFFSGDNERDSFLVQFMESLGDLEANELMRRDSRGLHLTELGTVASSSGMSLQSFYELVKVVKQAATKGEDVTGLLPLLCGFQEFQSLRPYDKDERAEALCDWVAGKPVSEIIEKYSARYELGAGHIRGIGETAAWVLNTAARIVNVSHVVGDGQTVKQELENLAQRCKYGVPTELAPIAELRVLHRSELAMLVNNSAGKILNSFHKILDATPDDFVGILSPQRAKALQNAILDRIGQSISSRRYGHAIRADKFAGLRHLVERCYDLQGTDFEKVLEELLNSRWVDINARRFGKQRTGQPDLEVTGSSGTVVIQATASQDGKKPISWSKAKEVLASVGYSGKATNYLTVGRPGFHEVAIGNATEMAERQDQMLLLLPLTELVEISLLEAERKIHQGSVLRVLEDSRGYFSSDEYLDTLGGTQ